MIPFSQIDTVFLDVGNTLISIDFDWVASELTARQYACDPETLRRAEAASRPAYSKRLFVDGLPAGTDLFAEYLRSILGQLAVTAALPAPAFDELIRELRPVFRPDGRANRLWRSVMPRVPEALDRLRTCGLSLVVVSNSDGTVESSLEAAGLRPYLTAVIDSALVGYDKPDPRIFTSALERVGAAPERTLHVGDLYHADVVGARSAGVHAILLDPYGDWSNVDCPTAPDLFSLAESFACKD